jgi:hypothetical protein
MQTKNQIEKILKSLNIKNYIINDNLIVDINTEVVDISFMGLTEIPVKFGIIKGYFNCAYNKLTTLKNAPIEVNDNFYCSNNELINLNGIPKIIKGKSLWVEDNKNLESLEPLDLIKNKHLIINYNVTKITQEYVKNYKNMQYINNINNKKLFKKLI